MKIGDRVYYEDMVVHGWGELVGQKICGRESECWMVRMESGYRKPFWINQLTEETSMDRIMKKLSEKGWSVTICGDWHGEVNDCYDEVIFRFNDKLALESWMFKRTIYHPISGKQVEISEESYQAMKKDWK